MRIYVPADLELLERLVAGERVEAEAFRGDTDDEEDEFAALEEAASHAPAVVAADVEAGEGFTLDDVAAFHLDVDGSGDLAWFATQEVDAVLRALRSTTPGG